MKVRVDSRTLAESFGCRVSSLVMCNDRLIEVDTFLFALPRSSLLLFDVFFTLFCVLYFSYSESSES